jgi:hypothetical protein
VTSKHARQRVRHRSERLARLFFDAFVRSASLKARKTVGVESADNWIASLSQLCPDSTHVGGC